jgi:two-component system, HptB-dependent secretion and biofilm response regulator
MRKIVQSQQQFFNAILRLEMYRDHVDEEQRIGHFIIERMTGMDSELASVVHRYMNPAEYIGGDILVAARTPADDIHILLADATGHGLSAAINVLPLSQAFHDLTSKGYSIGQIASNLNKLVKNFMPADRFVSAVLVSISRQDRVIEVWNGGIPTLRLFGLNGRLLQSWESRHLPLGILPAGDFSARSEAFRYEEDCQLCLFSDGLLDALSPQGMQFGEERIIGLLSGISPESRSEALVAELQSHLQGRSAHDDISFALIDVSAELPADLCCCELEARKTEALGDDWRIAFSLGASELKYLDVVPLLTQIISNIHVAGEHHSALFLVLSELFNNALDHGVLRLDSKVKLGGEGFEKYLELRDERLNALSDAKIEIEIEKVLVEDRTGIKIRIVDSGDGFDHEAVMAATAEQPGGIQHGRGIALTRNLVCRLEYAGKGNEVAAYYICG